jgi:protein-S-isoprenylcysteine O-methyltransferase Ste14
LGSFYGILVGIALTLVLVVRIIGEENLLVRELEGYAAYREKVRYRLIPRVW